MFRKRDAQHDLFEASNALTPEKRERLKKTWAEVFRNRALPIIEEERFAPAYCPDNGAPNWPVQVLVGMLILKEWFDLTDDETLERVEYDLLWHHALRLKPEEAHVCQKTLHNFRQRLLRIDGGRLAFEQMTARIVEELGIHTERQRLDSTHIVSNIAILTRLGLFCETIRAFLSKLRNEHPRLFERASERLRSRYLKKDGSPTCYHDARSAEGRRRLPIVARDMWRLVDLYTGTAASRLEAYGLLERLLREQCEVVPRSEGPGPDDDDRGEGAAPVELKPAGAIESDSLQSPHDPDVTYSGHKGKGYEVQIAETCHTDNPVEIITHVDVTRSCSSDQHATMPTLEALEERELRPNEMIADTGYGAATNAVAAERMGTELVSPLAGSATAEPAAADNASERALCLADFTIDVRGEKAAVCPAGHKAVEDRADPLVPVHRVIVFDRATCESCPLRSRCPVRLDRERGAYVLRADLLKANIERRRRAEASGERDPRYALRAGIEATNSELKRAHGLAKLRVRRLPRVRLAVFLKALACNVKRMVRELVSRGEEVALAHA